ncbi:hypothetical protein [Methanobrevibacter olleyae]|uniref:Uncharacterized protein n=1 Tax=Methanobrevibacter olleyae TaxID=294671 RepID=A0A126R2M2_METOL|nr:hypothetical protein [Methanobrevibacter olleyae]AMK16322.1 hypothetical protein YLM1_1767 [Methanobrevibacter olleyae]
MTKKKKESKKEVNHDFNLQKHIKEKVNPYLVEGFKKYIYENSVEINDEKEFEKVYKHYGGF